MTPERSEEGYPKGRTLKDDWLRVLAKAEDIPEADPGEVLVWMGVKIWEKRGFRFALGGVSIEPGTQLPPTWLLPSKAGLGLQQRGGEEYVWGFEGVPWCNLWWQLEEGKGKRDTDMECYSLESCGGGVRRPVGGGKWWWKGILVHAMPRSPNLMRFTHYQGGPVVLNFTSPEEAMRKIILMGMLLRCRSAQQIAGGALSADERIRGKGEPRRALLLWTNSRKDSESRPVEKQDMRGIAARVEEIGEVRTDWP